MLATTSALSAICGTHFGETNAPASTARKPASASRSIKATLTAAETAFASFWSPSRGPTSTIRTSAGRRTRGLLAIGREGDQGRTLIDEIARRKVHTVDDTVRRRHDRMLHLHGLEHEESLAPLHPLTGPGRHFDHFARHRRGKPAAASVELYLGLQRIDEREAIFDAVEQDDGGIVLLQQRGAMNRAIQGEPQCAIADLLTDLQAITGTPIVHTDRAPADGVLPAQIPIGCPIEAPPVAVMPR